MGYSNGVISAPVTIDDLKLCFGMAANDLVTLLANADINKWAACKPNKVSGNPAFCEYSNGVPTWAAGIGGVNKGYGLDYSAAMVDAVSALVAKYGSFAAGDTTVTGGTWTNADTHNTDWVRTDAPKVADGDAFRMGDMRGYNKNAVPVVGAMSVPEAYVRGGSLRLYNEDIPTDSSGGEFPKTDQWVHFKLYVPPSAPNDRVYLGNLYADGGTAKLTDWYFAFVHLFTYHGGTGINAELNIASETAASQLSSGNYLSVGINIMADLSTSNVNRWWFAYDQTGDKHVLVPCLCNASSNPTRLLALPNASPVTLYSICGTGIWTVVVYRVEADEVTPLRVEVYNNDTTASHTLSKLRISLRSIDAKFDPVYYEWANITVGMRGVAYLPGGDDDHEQTHDFEGVYSLTDTMVTVLINDKFDVYHQPLSEVGIFS